MRAQGDGAAVERAIAHHRTILLRGEGACRDRGTAADSARHREIAFAAGDRPVARPFGRNVMMTEHHPSDVVLLALAAGTLEAQRDAIAAHVRGCASCRAFVRAMEHVGGILLEELPPTSMASGSLSEMLARIEQPDRSPSAALGCPARHRGVTGGMAARERQPGAGVFCRRCRLLRL